MERKAFQALRGLIWLQCVSTQSEEIVLEVSLTDIGLTTVRVWNIHNLI